MRKKTPNAKDEAAARKALAEDKADYRKREAIADLASVVAPPLQVVDFSLTTKPKRGRPRGGFKKEKTQISVRIDQAVMDLAYQLINESNGRVRITGLLERGLVLAMREEKTLAPLARQARFLMAEAAPSDQLLWMDLMAWKYTRRNNLNAYERCAREFVLAYIGAIRSRPEYKPALEEMLGQALEYEYERP